MNDANLSARDQIEQLRDCMQKAIIGQHDVIERLLIGLLANGNLLVEGLPGLAKTRAIKALATNLEADFSRVQFTPDLLPSDVTGTEVFYQQGENSEFRFEPGPLFANIVLADEINRAPAKVQAALLEAMEERQVTVAGKTHKMDPLFMVMATQNPIEQEGTYPLPEAQMDRFLMHVLITYPSVEDEVEVICLVRSEEMATMHGQQGGVVSDAPIAIPQEAVFSARRDIANIHVSDAMNRYMVDLVNATRVPDQFGSDLARWIETGASPRASLALDRCSRTHAWMCGRDYVDPQDVHAIVADVLRHRLGLTFEAQGESVTPDIVITEILSQVALT